MQPTRAARRTGRAATSTASSGGDAGARHVPDWVVLAIACVAQFMVVLDVSIVNVALPSIGRGLHYSPTGLQWVVNAYVLTFAGFLLLGGRAADLFGRRRVYLLGMLLFTAASLFGGVAQNAAWLTSARALQGVGGAMVSPATLTIIVTSFRGARLPRALGVWGAVAGAGGVVGSLLGGVLTAELSWRWVLFVNIPIGIVAIAAAVTYLTEVRPLAGERARSLDVAGAISVTAGLGVLIYAIVGTDTHAWLSTYTLSLLGAGVVLLLAFTFIELKVAARPLVPFRIFGSRSVSGANAVYLFVGGAFSVWYFLSLYTQNVLGYSALRAGLAFLPMGVAVVVGAQFSSRALQRTGVRPLLLVGGVVATGGFFWLTQIRADSSYVGSVLGPGSLVAWAIGVLFTALASAGTTGVPRTEAGIASGVLNTSRQVGGSLGLAALATIASDRTRALLAAGHATADRIALTNGYAHAFAGAALLSLAALVCSVVVPSIRGRPDAGGTAAPPSAADREPPAPGPVEDAVLDLEPA
jgi:EmrB/QacA subfamily drug resistance transporter